jgi:hypothetical protein
MTPFEEGQEERIKKAVEDRLAKEIQLGRDPSLFAAVIQSSDTRDHIIRMGVSILCTKWEIGYPGGSFVQAIVNNDLMETFGRADDINVKCIRFYVSLLYNQSYVE